MEYYKDIPIIKFDHIDAILEIQTIDQIGLVGIVDKVSIELLRGMTGSKNIIVYNKSEKKYILMERCVWMGEINHENVSGNREFTIDIRYTEYINITKKIKRYKIAEYYNNENGYEN